MAWFRPARNRKHPGDPPPKWAPLGRAGRLVLAATVIAGVVIALMIMATRTAGAVDGTNGPIAAPDPSPPPWFAGRVAVVRHGFAVTLPEGWVAFDTGADVDVQVEAAQAHHAGLSGADLADLRQSIVNLDAQGLQILTTELSARVIEDTAVPQLCAFTIMPDGARWLDDEDAESLYQTYLDQESTTDVEPPRSIDLPVGSGWVFVMTAQSPDDPDYWSPAVLYLVAGDRDAFLASCTGPERPADDWLSIAETFEFLPAEE